MTKKATPAQQPSLFADDEVVTMVVEAAPVVRELPIAARDIRPGDVILTATGARDFAAFDRFVNHDSITVWTAVPDQDRGVPRLVELELDKPVTVARRVAR